MFPFRANLGFGGAVNFAAERARGGYLVLLNDDCVVQRGWLEALVDTEQRRERCAVVGSTYLNPDGSLQEAGALLWSDGTTDAVGAGAPAGYMAFERRVDYSSGGSLLIRKDVWDELGGLDESYYPAYFEDVDFCLRVVEAGWEVWYQPMSAVRHARSASTAIDFRQFLFRRARETFVDRWSSVLETREPKGQEERALWMAMGEPIRVLVIDDQIPDPSLGSGFGRMYDTLSMLEREPDLHVAFYPSTQPRPLPGFFGLRAVRVISDLEEHLATEGVDYDVVVISRPHNGELTPRAACPLPTARARDLRRGVLFHRRLSLQAEVEQDPDRRDALLAEAAAVKSREHLVVKAADSVVCISELEAAELREVTDAPVRVVAPFFEAPEPTPAGFEQRADVGFVAGWAAGPGSPNCDALLVVRARGHAQGPRVGAGMPSVRDGCQPAAGCHVARRQRRALRRRRARAPCFLQPCARDHLVDAVRGRREAQDRRGGPVRRSRRLYRRGRDGARRRPPRRGLGRQGRRGVRRCGDRPADRPTGMGAAAPVNLRPSTMLRAFNSWASVCGRPSSGRRVRP